MWEYKDVFLKHLPNGHPSKRGVEYTIKVELGSKPPNRSPYHLGTVDQDKLESHIKDLLS